MNCKQTREAIDTVSRRSLYGDSVTSHLNGCLDCRRYSEETSSLLLLLSAQPRVQAPADFDFKLRARIARAQAEQAAPATTLQNLQKIWAQTFSWGQAATAMAAAALVITASTIYINHRGQSQATAENPTTPAKVTVASNQNSPSVEVARPSVTMAASNQTPKLTHAKFTVRSKNLQNAVPEASAAQTNIAFNGDSTKIYNAEKRQVVSTPNRDTLIGVENAGLGTKPALVALTF